MDGYISRQEHNEYAKRMEDEHSRQNARIRELENAMKETRELTLSVEKLALTMQSMLEEQKVQGERLEVLENRDGEMWRKVTGHIISTVIGIAVGYFFKQLGM